MHYYKLPILIGNKKNSANIICLRKNILSSNISYILFYERVTEWLLLSFFISNIPKLQYANSLDNANSGKK